MRHPVIHRVLLGVTVVLLAACTSDPRDATETPSGDVSGGAIDEAGDLSADTIAATPPTEAPVQTFSTSPPLEVATTATADSVAATTSTITSDTTTTVGPTTTAAVDVTTTSATADSEVVGDGPVLTVGIDDDSGESPGVQTGITPVFFALEATTEVDCTTADPGTVRLRWEVIGAETVDVSVAFVGNIFSPDESPAGTIDLPLDCSTGSEYFVIAENPDGETIRSVSVAVG